MTVTIEPDTDGLRRMLTAVRTMAPAVDDADRIERVRLFEELKSVVTAWQMQESVEFAASQARRQAAHAVPAERRGRGVAAQLALAMRASPARAERFLGLAKILSSELPHTYAELSAGRTTEWRATLVARETACLSREHRAAVDADLAPRLVGLGDRKVGDAARASAYELDPAAAVARARKAERERRVTLRPAPDTMCWLTALLPVTQAVAAYAALRRYADTAIGTGANADFEGRPRTRDQVMADALVERVTGAADASEIPVEVNVVMTDQVLFGFGARRDEAAVLEGYGPVPAAYARDLVFGPSRPELAFGRDAPRWLLRFYLCPDTGDLVAMDSRRRLFTRAQQHLLRTRDQLCRTPWCNAPIRYADHVTPYADGGPTSLDNGEGYCAACNHAKQAPGWHTWSEPGRVVVVTPTGARYTSRPPTPPGRRRQQRRATPDAA